MQVITLYPVIVIKPFTNFNTLPSRCPLFTGCSLSILMWLNSKISHSINEIISYHQNVLNLQFSLLMTFQSLKLYPCDVYLCWTIHWAFFLLRPLNENNSRKCHNRFGKNVLILYWNVRKRHTELWQPSRTTLETLFKTALTIKHELMQRREELLIMEKVGNRFVLNKRTVSDMTTW